MKLDSILLDLDGTLWDPAESITDIWQKVITGYHQIVDPVSDRDIRDCMGLNTQEIEAKLFPKATANQRRAIMDECMEKEHPYLAEQSNLLYPQVEETLAALSANHQLAIVSNCEKGYIECFFAITGLRKYFDYYLSYGDTGKAKGENIITVLKALNSKRSIYVGDTAKDAEAARFADIPFVFARYGYGGATLAPEQRDYAIDSFVELLDLIDH